MAPTTAKKKRGTAPATEPAVPGPASSARAAAKSTATARKTPAAASSSAPKTPAKSPGATAVRARPAASGVDTPTEASAADLVDTQLAKYRSMRDFAVTAEPSGAAPEAHGTNAAPRATAARAKPATAGLPFVIQKHAASHLHYDFRLGWSGVLKSWAVAKGPSFYPGDRRLAVQVEDHPMEYGGFEGVIPQGQYGGGTVMVWDQGTWWPQPGHENVEAGLRTGSLKFEMHGTKMRGKWTLVRMHTTRPAPGENGRWRSSDKPQWLLIKEHDAFEQPQGAPAITEEAPDSALTGRTMEQIAHAGDHVWNSKETAGKGQAWYRQDAEPAPTRKPAAARKQSAGMQKEPAAAGAEAAGIPAHGKNGSAAAPATEPVSSTAGKPGLTIAARPRKPSLRDPDLQALPAERQPEFVAPALAQETEAPPDGSGWLHELKLDGYRMQARKSGATVQMLTRSGLDWTYRVQAVADAVAALPVDKATLDGEVVVVAADGTTNFADLQASFQQGEQHPLTFFCFDLLHLDGHNTRDLPLLERKRLLARLIPRDDSALVRLSEHLETGGQAVFHQACELHAEGIVSKRADSAYRAGRTADWLKAKCLHEQEFVVGGWSPSTDGPDRIGSLLIGYYRAKKLIYAGRTGTGFTQKVRKQLLAQLLPLETRTAPFAHVPAEARRGGSRWVRPELVAQVRFATWTAEDLVRQAAFLGLREDKRPEEVFREDPTAPPQPKIARHQPPMRAKAPGATAHTMSPSGTHPKKATMEGAPAEPAKAAAAPVQGQARSPEQAAHRSENTEKARKPGKAAATAPVRLTHPQKVLDPESGLTKQQLADFYWAVAERMLPHVAGRPLSLVRCPDGAGKPCFYQKHVNHMLPPGVGSVMVRDKASAAAEPYITLHSAEALAGLAQMGVLEIHPWSSCNGDLEHPDRLIFDLDPDESLGWQTVADAAREVRSRLKTAGLESFLKTTGGKGLHIVAPIEPQLEFAAVKEAAHRFVMEMERSNPRLYLTKMTKAARKGKIYLDYLRNERGATAVSPFSPRARPGVHASVTLEWKELDGGQRPSFAVTDFDAWRDRLRRDPWKRMLTLRQTLDPTRFRLR